MDSELLDVVNHNNEVIGQDVKRDKFEKEFISRNVAIFLVDDQGKLLITKRAPNKIFFFHQCAHWWF